MTTAVPTYNTINGVRLGERYVKVEATNVGHRPVTIKALGVQLPGGQRLASLVSTAIPGIPDTQLPVTLSDGQTAHYGISYANIGRALLDSGRSGKILLYPVCDDTAGDVHKGEPWEIDPVEYAQAQ